jgi:hypothetical protein
MNATKIDVDKRFLVLSWREKRCLAVRFAPLAGLLIYGTARQWLFCAFLAVSENIILTIQPYSNVSLVSASPE